MFRRKDFTIEITNTDYHDKKGAFVFMRVIDSPLQL